MHLSEQRPGYRCFFPFGWILAHFRAFADRYPAVALPWNLGVFLSISKVGNGRCRVLESAVNAGEYDTEPFCTSQLRVVPLNFGVWATTL